MPQFTFKIESSIPGVAALEGLESLLGVNTQGNRCSARVAIINYPWYAWQGLSGMFSGVLSASSIPTVLCTEG